MMKRQEEDMRVVFKRQKKEEEMRNVKEIENEARMERLSRMMNQVIEKLEERKKKVPQKTLARRRKKSLRSEREKWYNEDEENMEPEEYENRVTPGKGSQGLDENL